MAASWSRLQRRLTFFCTLALGYYSVLHVDYTQHVGGRKHVFSEVQEVYRAFVVVPIRKQFQAWGWGGENSLRFRVIRRDRDKN